MFENQSREREREKEKERKCNYQRQICSDTITKIASRNNAEKDRKKEKNALVGLLFA